MSQETFMQNNIEEAKKMAKDYRLKVESRKGISSKMALFVAVLNLIFLIAIPFLSVKYASATMFDMFDYDGFGGLKFFYVVNWITTIVVGIVGIVVIKKANEINWIKSHIITSLINLFTSFMLFVLHLSEVSDVSECYLWRLVPVVVGMIYFVIPVMAYIYNKAVIILETKIAEIEK